LRHRCDRRTASPPLRKGRPPLRRARLPLRGARPPCGGTAVRSSRPLRADRMITRGRLGPQGVLSTSFGPADRVIHAPSTAVVHAVAPSPGWGTARMSVADREGQARRRRNPQMGQAATPLRASSWRRVGHPLVPQNRRGSPAWRRRRRRASAVRAASASGAAGRRAGESLDIMSLESFRGVDRAKGRAPWCTLAIARPACAGAGAIGGRRAAGSGALGARTLRDVVSPDRAWRLRARLSNASAGARGHANVRRGACVIRRLACGLAFAHDRMPIQHRPPPRRPPPVSRGPPTTHPRPSMGVPGTPIVSSVLDAGGSGDCLGGPAGVDRAPRVTQAAWCSAPLRFRGDRGDRLPSHKASGSSRPPRRRRSRAHI
jgi:hypothetical protein